MSTCAEHTYGPSGYPDWHEWAEEMSKTHVQQKCGTCGCYLIWEPKALDNGHAETPEIAALNGRSATRSEAGQ
jgi:hypothetical protein